MSGNQMSTSFRRRIFISYGRRDATALAEKIRAELVGRGFDVWVDTSELRAGRSWEEQIIDGLRGTDVVVALLSPHSTRKSETGEDDSVCLDELALARYGQPSKPIVPILAVTGASIPLTVLRLHYLDFVNALSSDLIFKHKLDELVTAIDAAVSGRIRYRGWDTWLTASLDFDRFLYSKHQGFVGREWLFRRIDSWRRSQSEAALIITGDPGIGKSSVVAELEFGAFSTATLATYCCQWDVLETLRPAAFVRTVAYQCASRLTEFAEQLDTPEIRRSLERSDSDPRSAFELGVLTPLARLDQPVGGPILLCIDALDEAANLHEGLTIVDLLAHTVDRLPTWLKVVATTRDNKIVMRHFGGCRTIALNATGQENIGDLNDYVRKQLERSELHSVLDSQSSEGESLLRSLVERSEGSFLYANYFLEGLSRGTTLTDDLDNLPPGLDGIYERYLRRGFPTASKVEQIRPVLEVLCAAFEPVPRSLLAEASGFEQRALVRLLQPLTPFLKLATSETTEPGLTFWHKSFSDFLTDIENADSDFGIDGSKGDERFASLFVRRALGIDTQTTSAEALPIYLRIHGLEHLALCGRFFAELSDDQAKAIVYCSSWVGEPGWRSVGSLPRFAPAFVAEAIKANRFETIERLINALFEATRRHYIDSGLINIRKEQDGSETTLITGQATESVPLYRALLTTGMAIFVVDQFLAALGAKANFAALVKRLEFMDYMARGLDIASWAHRLSGYFADQGSFLSDMIRNLEQGRRAEY